jgi:hypothetical protein
VNGVEETIVGVSGLISDEIEDGSIMQMFAAKFFFCSKNTAVRPVP